VGGLTRWLRVLLVAGIGAAGLVTASGQDAGAAEWSTLITRQTWAYTDSRSPHTAFVDPAGDLPVGAWRDAQHKLHKSKVYFTFDLAPLRGARIFRAEAFVAETAANDCGKPRATELWLTDTATRPTWARQPRERTKLAGPGALPGCLWSRVEWDATPVVQQALAAGRTTITLALRMPQDRQDDVRYGRRYANDLSITVRYNFPPDTPTELNTNDRPCAAEPPYIGDRSPRLEARVTDPDGGLVAGRFAVWPEARPGERREFERVEVSSGSFMGIELPDGIVTENEVWAWSAQADDRDDVSAWSEPCRFVTDFTRPNVEPGVSSDVYREHEDGGGPGIPGDFVFSANGVADVVGFHYGEFEPSTFVAADRPGGTARITFTPDRSGPVHFAVRSVDRAGLLSPIRRYEFFVREFSPGVSCVPEDAELGVPRECTFTPGMDDVVSYTYRFNADPQVTVPASADGTARVTLVPPSGSSTIAVFSTTRQGVRSPTAHHVIFLFNEPAIGCLGDVNAGEPLECTFWPTNMSDVAEYRYRLNDGPETVVPAEADGTARATFVIDQPGWNELSAVATTSQGLPSSPGRYQVYLFTSPLVSSEVYPFNQGGGGPGVAGEFVFGPGAMPNVAEYVYSFDSEPEVVVPAGPDGRATVTFTPDRSGWMDLTVHSRTADGATSDSTYYPFLVNPS
jgi:hypothetical protein